MDLIISRIIVPKSLLYFMPVPQKVSLLLSSKSMMKMDVSQGQITSVL